MTSQLKKVIATSTSSTELGQCACDVRGMVSGVFGVCNVWGCVQCVWCDVHVMWAAECLGFVECVMYGGVLAVCGVRCVWCVGGVWYAECSVCGVCVACGVFGVCGVRSLWCVGCVWCAECVVFSVWGVCGVL